MGPLKSFTAGVKSWKTTLAGILGGLAVLALAGQALLDGDPATTVNSEAVLEAIAGISLIIWGLFSRDADKSSQDSGVR